MQGFEEHWFQLGKERVVLLEEAAQAQDAELV
jgi:hypothetical protein